MDSFEEFVNANQIDFEMSKSWPGPPKKRQKSQ